MLCERYKKALIEAAALGQRAEELSPEVREHVGRCAECESMFDAERALQWAIRERVRNRVATDVPTSLAVRVRRQVAKESNTSDGFRLQRAAAAAAISVVFAVALVRVTLHRSQVPGNVAVNAWSIAGTPTRVQPSSGEAEPMGAKKRAASRSPRQQNITFSQRSLKPLVAPGQQETMELVVRQIRKGAIDGGLLRLDATPETGELQLKPIEIEALETVNDARELDPDIANGQLRKTERSTR